MVYKESELAVEKFINQVYHRNKRLTEWNKIIVDSMNR